MKRNSISFIVAVVILGTTQALAQKTVQASDIMKDVRDGRDVSYQNVTIVGDLDFTFKERKDQKLGTHRWWNGGNTINEDIDVRVSFVNCVFEGDVLAYIHDKRSGYTFTADFEDDVTFKGCDFQRNAMFKYSEFDGVVSFSGTKFNRENSFKYAEFDNKADFSDTMFDEDAIFKYAEFDDGVSFNGTEFRESWDIKYLDVSGSFDIDNMEVSDDIDAKYTEINGESFTKHLYRSRKN